MTYRDEETAGHEDGLIAEEAAVRPPLKMVGEDGNAWAILGRARVAARSAGWTDAQWEAVNDDAMSGDYDHLLRTMMENFDCDA